MRMEVLSVRCGSSINLLKSNGPWKIIDRLVNVIVVFGCWNVLVISHETILWKNCFIQKSVNAVTDVTDDYPLLNPFDQNT